LILWQLRKRSPKGGDKGLRVRLQVPLASINDATTENASELAD